MTIKSLNDIYFDLVQSFNEAKFTKLSCYFPQTHFEQHKGDILVEHVARMGEIS